MAEETVVKHPFGPEIAIEVCRGVHLVTLDRPASLNAIDGALHRALSKVWEFLSDDHDARSVVLTGRGRAFSAGGDLDHVVDIQNDRDMRRGDVEEARKIVATMIDCPLPIIAAVNGPAVGLGCNLALSADLVYMAESAYLADPHVRVGLTAGDGGAAIWPVLTSMVQAKEYLFTGDRIDAREAMRIGLATRTFPDDVLVESALAMGVRLASLPRQALESTKRACNMHMRRVVLDALDFALASEFQSFDTADHRGIIQRMRSELASGERRTRE